MPCIQNDFMRVTNKQSASHTDTTLHLQGIQLFCYMTMNPTESFIFLVPLMRRILAFDRSPSLHSIDVNPYLVSPSRRRANPAPLLSLPIVQLAA
jgi:hypothetical protein